MRNTDKHLLHFVILIFISATIHGQVVSDPFLAKIRKGGSGNWTFTHLTRPYGDNKYVITGYVMNGTTFPGYASDTVSSCNGFPCYSYIAGTDKNGQVQWINYFNGAEFYDLTVDSKGHIYTTGMYKDVLISNTGDTLPLLSNNTNHYGNIFILKLDSFGKIKWMRTTDNEAYAQFEPQGVYIRTDPEDNIYLSGLYEQFIRFDNKYFFERTTPFAGFTPFLAKLDSSGNYLWVRDWNADRGLPSGLFIEQCKIYDFAVTGANPGRVLKLRIYDLAGKLLDAKYYPFGSIFMYGQDNIALRNNEFVTYMDSAGYLKTISMDIDGNRNWDIQQLPAGQMRLKFTSSGKLFIMGESSVDSVPILNQMVYPGIYFGFLNDSTLVSPMKTIPNVHYLRDAYFDRSGGLYFNAVVSKFSNSGQSTFTIDTFSFSGLNYLDSTTGTDAGIIYRLYGHYDLQETLYYNPGNCNFSLQPQQCLDREGICQLPTGLPGVIENNLVDVFPNPATTTVNIHIKNWRPGTILSIYDNTGRLVRKMNLFSAKTTVSFSNGAGIYYLNIARNGNTLYTNKLVVTH